MLLLFESAAGFALFKVADESKLSKVDNIWSEFEADPSLVTLKEFKKFENTAEALEACTALVESKLSKGLQKFLKKALKGEDDGEQVAVADAKLAGLIKEKVGCTCTAGSNVQELLRCVRSKLPELLNAAAPVDVSTMSLGLAHSFSRYKLKFSPDKVDTMIVQAISLLDDLDKEINTYSMRVREWYGWHFPELGKIIADNLTYAKLVRLMGTRDQIPGATLSEIVPESVEAEVKELSQVSMGTEISAEDLENIRELCTQVIDITEYREQLFDYLRNRMQAIAPNLSTLVGELVGARLIAHTGSLINLAKYPASTVQILGAEKALFRALKQKKKTPKYGLIYHASLIGQAPAKNKGQISRVLAAKAALCSRVDALGEAAADAEPTVGIEGRTKVESRLRIIEGRAGGAKFAGGAKKTAEKYSHKVSGGMARDTEKFDVNADTTMKAKTPKRKRIEEPAEEAEEQPEAAAEAPAKKKKRAAVDA
eukprot:m51a1_g6809 putative nucleolar protein 5 (483) ;mRNA; f:259321-261182